MFDLARRRVLAVLAVALSGLGVRRAAALPVAPLPVPLPIEPVPAPPIVVTSGWWQESGSSWAYHLEHGWMHANPPLRNLVRAQWYGPPPPMVPTRPIDWAKVETGDGKPSTRSDSRCATCAPWMFYAGEWLRL